MRIRGLVLLLVVAVAAGDSYPPGDYLDTGRVVRLANGEVTLFDGFGCLTLTEKVAKPLLPHVGAFVLLDYTRVEYKKGEEGDLPLFDSSGAPIGRINRVKVLAKDAQALPVRITARPTKASFALGEPVKVELDIVNAATKPVALHLDMGECLLLRDYHCGQSLAPERPTKAEAPTVLAPGKHYRAEIESAWMMRPGRYDVMHIIQADPAEAHALGVEGELDFYYQSDPVPVEVEAAPDAEAEHEALRAWLPRASASQCIRIADRLLALGDRSGVAEVLRRYKSPDCYIYGPGYFYRFLWQHGGAEGEKLLMAELNRGVRDGFAPPPGRKPSGTGVGEAFVPAGRVLSQGHAEAIIQCVFHSPRAVPLFEGFLQDKRETRNDFSGWCERPRICDVTASLLAGYTKGAMKFPQHGSVKERDAAVAEVLAVLRTDPTRFSPLSKRR